MFINLKLRNFISESEKVMLKNITKGHLTNVCKIGQKEITCRYIIVNKDGVFCGKVNERTKQLIDDRVSLGKLLASGNNCNGFK